MKHRSHPILFYLAVHCTLLFVLDLRDMPGAAGTETVYKAAIGERKGDETVLILQWIAHYLDVGPYYASRILSSLSFETFSTTSRRADSLIAGPKDDEWDSGTALHRRPVQVDEGS